MSDLQMPAPNRESVAEAFEHAAGELRSAAEHCAVAAKHYRESDVPPGAAHAFAAEGHLRRAERLLAHISEIHASKFTV